ncbi:TPA: hypothetical protein NJY97_005255 [Vibrio parahaemolyticus]|nr:hypothetical protein [Vibrio parahaemolyticus]HCE1608078.1 hypothetical protein [Vibrio parahaemolyticus]HCE5231182.1 hypothetical protein [Vibrio parahaemolyticus]HCE5233146.1 hypothetical protein [Vibrio parahaemolyticus]HCG5109547.1 hypothetical protein [Vibrio parahaemolyticus]
MATHESMPESRHIQDLVFGVMCLEKAGIKPGDIYIYIDGDNKSLISSHFQLGTAHSYPIKDTSEFFQDLKTYSHDNLVMFVSGHGCLDGIAATPSISPHKLTDTLKSSPNLKHSVVYLGQCYAGTFNYMNVAPSEESPNCVIFVGATGLHESLSIPTKEVFLESTDGYPWVANVFLLHIFKWISAPKDVDDDGKLTIIDSYKYAGFHSNMSRKDSKLSSFHFLSRSSIDLADSFKALESAQRAHTKCLERIQLAPNGREVLNHLAVAKGTYQNLMGAQIKYRSCEKEYIQQSSTYNVHQECWILNSIPAQSLEL